MKNDVTALTDLIRLTRPIGWILLVLPGLWMLLIVNNGQVDTFLFIKFILGAFFTRSAGCIINDYWDRDIDKKISRTKNRPLASGRATPLFAFIILFFFIIGACIIALSLNNKIWYLILIVTPLIILYPIAKRYSHYPQIVLAMTFASVVPFASIAFNGEVTRTTLLLYMITAVWVVIYDTQYAVSDLTDDINAEVKSLAVLIKDNLHLGLFLMELLHLLGWVLLLQALHISTNYQLLISTTIIVFAIYQHALLLPRYSQLCQKCFYTHGYLGTIILAELYMALQF